jgi:ABC-type multidrug transport system ATPase subunit
VRKKKIEIIVTLLLEKELYLLDEVENSLDATSRQVFKNWIINLSKN